MRPCVPGIGATAATWVLLMGLVLVQVSVLVAIWSLHYCTDMI